MKPGAKTCCCNVLVTRVCTRSIAAAHGGWICSFPSDVSLDLTFYKNTLEIASLHHLPLDAEGGFSQNNIRLTVGLSIGTHHTSKSINCYKVWWWNWNIKLIWHNDECALPLTTTSCRHLAQKGTNCREGERAREKERGSIVNKAIRYSRAWILAIHGHHADISAIDAPFLSGILSLQTDNSHVIRLNKIHALYMCRTLQ